MKRRKRNVKKYWIIACVLAFGWCDVLTIYCEAESRLGGWGSGWNSSNRPVVWGYKGEE